MIIMFLAPLSLDPYRPRKRHLRRRNVDVREMLWKPIKYKESNDIRVPILTEFLILHQEYNHFRMASFESEWKSQIAP